VEVVKIPRVLNKEILLLVALSLAAFGVFVFTRHMAAREQQLEAKIAAIWFERGMQYMHSGETDMAIQAFRNATADIGDNHVYVLALANALAAENHDAEAQQLLLRLRESDPENAEININLARLAAKDGEVQEAVRYYQSALYGRWSSDEASERRQLRIEFVRFLLAHQQYDLASSELLILQARTPESASAHIEVAKLFVEADDQQHALQEFTAALRVDGNNVEALTGAGETAFEVGDYTRAEQYLKAALPANPDSQKTRQLLTLTEMVQSQDPLLPHHTAVERRTRLLAGLDLSMKRLESCMSQTAGSSAGAELQSLKSEALAVQPKLSSKTHPPDFDAVRSGVDLIFRMEQAASEHCGEPAPEDEALLLIGRQHAKERP
jgi:tetratricopeptide (TPR) repeat protein